MVGNGSFYFLALRGLAAETISNHTGARDSCSPLVGFCRPAASHWHNKILARASWPASEDVEGARKGCELDDRLSDEATISDTRWPPMSAVRRGIWSRTTTDEAKAETGYPGIVESPQRLNKWRPAALNFNGARLGRERKLLVVPPASSPDQFGSVLGTRSVPLMRVVIPVRTHCHSSPVVGHHLAVSTRKSAHGLCRGTISSVRCGKQTHVSSVVSTPRGMAKTCEGPRQRGAERGNLISRSSARPARILYRLLCKP